MKMRTFLAAGMLAFAALAPGAELPADIRWVTNYDDPPIGDPKALKGGTFYTFMEDYPLTFRLIGPNSNDAFASWNRAYTQDFGLVVRHPTTDNWIPWMATHWAVMPDNQTVYYKLHPKAKWSDGKPVTADDYVFTYEMMQSPHIVDPFYANYVKTYYTSVEKVDDLTLKIVGTQPSWKPLAQYNIWATPRHQITLDENYVQNYNLVFPLTVGPYSISEAKTGERVVFKRDANWWGKDEHYWQGMYNPDEIAIKVIPLDRELDYFRKGELSFVTVSTARTWAEDIPGWDEVKKGWVHRKRLFTDTPQGIYGITMNLTHPLFKNKDFRKAIQYGFDFDTLNSQLMYNAYMRQASAFTGTEYAAPDLKPYPFDPRKVREHLAAAGFDKRGPDGIWQNAKGEKASFTLIYGNKGLERHMTVLKETYKKLGINVELQLMAPATAFERGLERKYEATITSRTAGFYPEPEQYFHSKFLAEVQNNNVWAFGGPETDKLIDTFKWDLDKAKRQEAMFKLDHIVADEAFYIPFWTSKFIRFVHWDDVCFPDFYFPKRTEQYSDWQVFWIDPAKKQRLEEAKAKGTSLGEDTNVDADPYGIKAQFAAETAEPAAPGRQPAPKKPAPKKGK